MLETGSQIFCWPDLFITPGSVSVVTKQAEKTCRSRQEYFDCSLAKNQGSHALRLRRNWVWGKHQAVCLGTLIERATVRVFHCIGKRPALLSFEGSSCTFTANGWAALLQSRKRSRDCRVSKPEILHVNKETPFNMRHYRQRQGISQWHCLSPKTQYESFVTWGLFPRRKYMTKGITRCWSHPSTLKRLLALRPTLCLSLCAKPRALRCPHSSKAQGAPVSSPS